MKNHLLLTAIFGSLALVCHVSSAVALSPAEIGRIAKQTTVQITKCDRGSGAIVQKNGNTYTVLTVAHVVKKADCEIVTPDNARYRVTQVKTFPNNIDLAVITFTSTKNYPIAKFIDNSDRVTADETIYVSGFPVATATKTAMFTCTSGTVVSNSTKQQGKGYSLIYSHHPRSGDSGSPVWNDRGELIAIQGQGDVDTRLQQSIDAAVRARTGYHLAITINTFTKLASAAGIGGYKPVIVVAKPNPVDDAIASSVLNESKADYRGMLADLDQAIFLDSQNPRLYYGRGVAKTILGNSDAIADYNFALSLNLNEPLVYFNRGVAKAKFGENQGAIADFDRAIAINSNRAETYYHRGNAKVELGNRKGGIEDLNRAIAIDPNLAPAYYSRGLIKSKLGDKKGEIEDLNRTISLNPNYPAAHYRLGLAKLAANDAKGAIESFSRVIILNPKDAEAYNDRGLAKSKLGDKKGAIVDLNQAAARYKLQRRTASYHKLMAEIQRISK